MLSLLSVTSTCKLEGCIVCSDKIQYSPEAVRFPCRRCLLPAFDDAQCRVSATEWCQRYLSRYLFSVSNSVCFSSIYRSTRQAAPALRRAIGFDTQYRTSDVAENLGRYVYCTERTVQWLYTPYRSVQLELKLDIRRGSVWWWIFGDL